METRQRQVMDAYVRVRQFLDEHPAKGALTYASAQGMLDDVIGRLRGFASAQYRGRELSRAEVRRREEQEQVLLDQHIRPIVTIARAQIEPDSDVGIPEALRMPRLPITASKLITVCDGMMEAAQAHEALFVANGLPADFLAQFAAARDALERAVGGRASQVGSHIAARAGLAVQIKRGRRAVERLDALVRASYRNDPATLAAWRGAKRVQRAANGAGAPAEPEPEAVPVATPEPLPKAA